jgi:DNA polymerase elongation subunit (family B)
VIYLTMRGMEGVSCFAHIHNLLIIIRHFSTDDPIQEINAKYQEEAEITFKGNEEKILEDFCKYVLTKDPDILLSPKTHYRSSNVLKYLFSRIEELGIDVGFGRDGQTVNRNSIEGRIYFDSDSFQSLVEAIEKCRFACLPLGLAASYGTE